MPYIQVPERAEAVKLAFALYATGSSSDAGIARDLNQRGHRMVSKRHPEGYPFTKDTLTALLQNPFYYGLVSMLAESERPIWTQMSFAVARDNLMEAARQGIDASVYWPGLGEVPLAELTLRRLLPLAREGLRLWQVDHAQADRMLAVIEQRCLTGRTGATWQADTVRALQHGGGLDRDAALREMTQRYITLMHMGEPVHTWPVG